MDYFSKTPIRLLFLILIVPTLLWGYGKAIVRFAQITNSASERGENATGSADDRKRAHDSARKTNTEATHGIDAKRGLPQVADTLIETAKCSNSNDGDSSAVSQTFDEDLDGQMKKSLDDARLAKSPDKSSNSNPENVKELGLEIAQPGILESKKDLEISKKSIDGSVGGTEPDGESATYSNRVLKPVIPVLSRTTDDRNLNSESVKTNAQASVIRVLGIPTILFTGLFFVMWGIISGRIQRIMF